MKIEVSMIVKNEESCIAKCLESIKDADLITIIDTGSSDNTIEIAKKYTDKVYSGEEYLWRDDFAFHRNQSLEKCEKGNWILVIDADEVLEKNGINKIRKFIKNIPKEKRAVVFDTISSDLENTQNRGIRLFLNDGNAKWYGVAHNYLGISNKLEINSNLKLYYGLSKTHEQDSYRTLRILKKYVKENPNCLREKYYLAREYYYKRDCKNSLKYFNEYIQVATYQPELADAFMISAYCFFNTGDFNSAKDCCIRAIMINTDFKEPFLLLSKLCGSKNNKKWLEFSKLCTNKDVLFIRTNDKKEKTEEFYNKVFSTNYNMNRYKLIFKSIRQITGDISILDIGCGIGELSNYYKNQYYGFDFSEVAINKAIENYKLNNDDDFNIFKKFWIGNVYDKKNYISMEYYISTEVFEHVDDLKLLKNIKSGQKLIFTVPSFNTPAHLRTYTEEFIKERYKELLEIKNIIRFNWNAISKKWDSNYKNTKHYILLIESIKK